LTSVARAPKVASSDSCVIKVRFNRMGISSKWRLVDMTNGEAYQKAIHTPEEHLAKLRLLVAEIKSNPDAYVEELVVDKEAKKVRRVVYIKGEMKKDSGLVELNKEFEHKIPDGRTVKSKIVLEGDHKLVCTEKGPDFEATVVLDWNGADEINATLTSGGVVATEKYKRV